MLHRLQQGSRVIAGQHAVGQLGCCGAVGLQDLLQSGGLIDGVVLELDE